MARPSPSRSSQPRSKSPPQRRAQPARRHRLITLTSDFGLHDPYVGIMKSRIAQRAPGVTVIDLTHEITPFQPEEAGYWLWCCHGQFPPGTVHVAVVDPGVGGERAIALLEAAGQVFIAPDNGLLGLIAQTRSDAVGCRLDPAVLPSLGLGLHSATFHGRDVMAPLAAELVSGRVTVERLGTRRALLPGRLRPAVRSEDGSLQGQVAVVDRFGNALTTIEASALRARRAVRLAVGSRQLRLVRTYGEARPGECVGLINSASMLEIAAREASAAALLALQVGSQVWVIEGAGAARPRAAK